MRASRALGPKLWAALAPRTPRCGRHCQTPLTGHRLESGRSGYWQVYACRGGAVSITSYAERTSRDPTEDVRSFLRRRAHPSNLVTRHDLRLATRHGPELGRSAERFLARSRPRRPVRVVYWRLYPFRDRKGESRRLFACFRHGREGPVFFSDAATAPQGTCPICGGRGPGRTRRRT
jgi:hypothetical protein